MGVIEHIFIAAKAAGPMQALDCAELVAGRGIPGDRYYEEVGTFSEKLAGLPDKELTLIEAEQIDAFNQQQPVALTYAQFRRNLVTRGINLNALEGREFTIGGVRLRGVRLCEPCAHLADLLVPDVVRLLVHKTGLRARILDSGTISVGDILRSESV